MESIPSFNALLEKSVVKNWNLDALTDYKGVTLQYKDVARKIEKLHILFEESGIKKGDKIALCGRNSSNWGVVFLSILTYGAVAVPILHEFKADQIYNIVEHSGSRLLFVGDYVATQIDVARMPQLEGVVYIPDFSLVVSHSERLTNAREQLNALYGHKYQKYFRPEHVQYHIDSPDELAIINYTSGTTGFSKGVMIPYRALWSNMHFAKENIGKYMKAGDPIVSILPMAHTYGMSLEFLFEFTAGVHIYFLPRIPSPQVVQQAFSDIKPVMIIAVPLIVEKIIRKMIFPKTEQPMVKLMMKMPGIGKKVKENICKEVCKVFGGNFKELMTGGAAMNRDIERFLVDIGFPYTTGYGTTETAPIITYCDHKDYRLGTCGRAAVNMEVKIDSRDPENIVGEILTRGTNLMLGYYKDPLATAQAIDKDGWYHTGDLGIMDKDGFVYIKGRCKNLILGPSGQNIYPEEIEDKLNNMPLVNESLIIQDETDHKLKALIFPDYAEAEHMGFGEVELNEILEHNCSELNQQLPAYSQIAKIELAKTEFEKTAKRSIKRYLYKKA